MLDTANRSQKLRLNYIIAGMLREISDLLEQQHANSFRVNAYRMAAKTLEDLQVSVKDLVDQKGFEGITDLAHIGEGIGRSIYEYVVMEKMTRLENLKGGTDPEALLQTVPGIGPRLAARIHEDLHIETLEALELAIHNGRLKFPGLGKRRLAAIEASLSQKLGKRKQSLAVHALNEPPVELLLEIDLKYREAAKEGRLPTIAPKRFNPEKKSWLPVLHTTKRGWHFSALFSNTARAHDLRKTNDWVVLYFYDDHHQEGQHTVVTETHGPLQGMRVVRGRELECREYYDKERSR